MDVSQVERGSARLQSRPSWFETRGLAALLTMRILDLILRRRVSAVSKDEAPELKTKAFLIA